MKYDFDTIIPRRNTNSLKYDFARERGKPENVLPLWVADMDFQVPSEVTQKLVNVAQHGIFGYTETKQDYFEAVRNWFEKGFGYAPEAGWLVKSPGVVFAIATAIRAYTSPGDSVMIQQPVYYPFSEVVRSNSRRLISNQLMYRDGRYEIDFDDFNRKLEAHRVKLFILCNPHNPVGRVWTEDELMAMGDLCLRHGCLVVSDEIHCDFIYPGYKHTVFSTLSPEHAANTILCTAPSKTFNLAGLQVSNIFIRHSVLRQKFRRQMLGAGYSQLNTMGLAACQAAYEHGQDWLTQLKAYVTANLDFLRDFIVKRLPQIKLVEPQGTYLVWLDFSGLKMDAGELNDWIVNRAGLWLDDGPIFGLGGEGFQRINIACPRAILEQALLQLEQALKSDK